MNNLKKLLTSKLSMIALAIIFQIFLIWFGVYAIRIYFISIYQVLAIFSVLFAIYISNRDDNPSYRLTWIMLILAIPVFGVIIYFIFGAKKVPKSLRERDETLQNEMLNSYNIERAKAVENEIAKSDPSAYKQMEYIYEASYFPVFNKTETTYFKTGEECFEVMKCELEKAKKYIFLEYFIIDEGEMWDEILEILVRKSEEGVDVRLIYDDFGCCTTLPNYYDKKLNSLGLKAKAFNPLKPMLIVQMNNRDHRKILVVDGKMAMCGGINLADEYINRKERFGYWKDGGCMIKGEGVWSFTLMFLQFWNYDEKQKDDYSTFRVDKKEFESYQSDGLVQPFCDTPTDDEQVGENVHINMINNANKYLYITTPYLVIDQEVKKALILAAKNGVDVRIVVPHIPDKWYVFQLTRHNYQQLTKNGVKIYEYTPGFIHAKNMFSDDKFAIIGTINMDYRSYYLHYECGIWYYQSSLIKDMKEDYKEILKVSEEITYEDCMQVKLPVRILRAVLNVIAPLM